MAKNINEVYVDVLTGHLHVVLNELFNAKANLVVLDDELQNAISLIQKFQHNESENLKTITEQIERIRELESVVDNLKNENETKSVEYSKVSTLQNKLDEFVKRITEYKTTLASKDEEIVKLNRDKEFLVDEIKTLKGTTNQGKKLKK